ncbi:uracil-DNA glycosylase [Candidatus Pelagibacter sp.]|nr:uracil-DNA glycosylase [Candidatus Pelagibacter sp.]|tara:strand:+ start:458 stop:1189 length:732 start_codon:yes stop_codon:yes gene_type:complete
MSKKVINQNTNYDSELLSSIDYNFIFDENPINRLKNNTDNLKKDNSFDEFDKEKKLNELKLQINSINDCNLKANSKKIVLGDGNINSSIMLVGEAPSIEEDNSGQTFLGEAGDLLKKMLKAINIKKENIYTTYAVNFRPPEDRKPTPAEIKRYSQFLQKQISIIKPKIIILMGSTAMESLTGLNSKISLERGKWKEVIVKNTSYNVIITFNPSYLLRVPENKKHSWEDLKKIKQKIIDLKLNI